MRRLTGPPVAMALIVLGLGLGRGPATVAGEPDGNRVPAPGQVRQWHDFPIQIKVSGATALRQLLARVPLADFNREGLRPDGLLSVRVTAAEAAALTAAGVPFTRVADIDRSGRLAVERAWAQRRAAGQTARWPRDKSDDAALDYYPTHAEVGALLDTLAAAYPTLCRTFNWGQSVQGRELWGIVISADVNQTAAEPEVRLSSTMHGDEVVGMVMLLDLAHYLARNCDQPGYDAVTELLNRTEIHIMPLHNPDGYVLGTRYNADGVDLNRDFPLPAGTHPVPAVENQNFMAYASAHHFVISANGHGGALVVNYPWDYTHDLAPDDAAFVPLSLEYATWNLPMYDNPVFSQGITNGAQWYVATGTAQDWSYDQTGCIDVTIELGNTKWPPAASLAGYWDENRESLLHYAAAARFGVNGVVTDAATGAPLDAVVAVSGITKTVRTDPQHGDYYKVLASGTYDLVFSAENHDSVTVPQVVTTWGNPAVVDVALPLAGSDVPRAGPVAPQLAAAPNPFNPGTSLTLTMRRPGAVRLGIYDVSGRLVRNLLDAELAAGAFPLVWDGRDAHGARSPSGLYLARARTTAGSTFLKLMLVK